MAGSADCRLKLNAVFAPIPLPGIIQCFPPAFVFILKQLLRGRFSENRFPYCGQLPLFFNGIGTFEENDPNASARLKPELPSAQKDLHINVMR